MDSILQPQFIYARLSEESETWRIIWWNRHPETGEMTRVRKTFKLNRIKSLPERRRQANEFIKVINEALDKGYNYFVDTENLDLPQPEKAVISTHEKIVTISDALARSHRVRVIGLAGRSLSSYASFTNKFTQYLESEGIDQAPASSFTTEHYYRYLSFKQQQGHGNRNINATTYYLRSVFEIMADKLHLIGSNPLRGIDVLPEGESTLFVPLTAEEIERIAPALIAYNPRFYLYCKFIPDEYIRPHHIARLKAGDISYANDEITLGGITTKSKRNTTKQLIKSLKNLLLEMECNKIPGNHYLFANTDFEPGPKMFSSLSIRAAEIWKKVVIDGLGIDKKMYALKHTSAQYFVNNNANVDVYYLRQQLEHSSARETEIYLQRNVKKRVKDGEVNTLKF
jgi:integrase